MNKNEHHFVGRQEAIASIAIFLAKWTYLFIYVKFKSNFMTPFENELQNNCQKKKIQKIL